MSDLLTRMFESVEKAEQAARATVDVLTGAVDVPVNVDGVSVPSLATRVRDYLANTSVLDGEDGKSLEYIEVREDGHLWAKIEGQPEADLGKIVPDEPIGVEYAQYDDVSGTLEISLTDGTTIGPINVKGQNAVEADEAFIEGGNLKIRMTDGTVLDAGDISRFGGAGVVSADINEAGQLIAIYTNGTTQNLGRVRGEKGNDGVSLVSAGIDAFGVLRFLRSDGRTATAGLVNATILDSSGNTVEGVSLGGVDGKELILSLTTGDINLGKVVGDDGADGVDGVDGVGIENITSENGHLIIHKSDGTTFDAGLIQVTRVFNAGSTSIGTASINANGELIIGIDTGSGPTPVNVGKVVGESGTILTSASINEDSELVFTDSESNIINAGVVEQVTITDVDVDENGYLDVTLSDGTTFKSSNPVKGSDGVDGVGIASVYIQDGDLWVSYEGGELADANLGRVVASVETNVVLENDQLTFTMSDGQTFGPFDVAGTDGVYLVSAEIVEGRLKVVLSNDTENEIDIGSVEQDPVNAVINGDGTLSIGFSDGTVLTTTERVKAFDGDTITGISFNAATGSLNISYTTGNRTGTQVIEIPAVRGYGVQDVQFDSATGRITITTNVPGKETVSFDVAKGIDGASIKDIYREDNDLVIEYSDRGDYDATNTVRALNVYKEGSIESILLDENDNLVINVDILDEPLVFPTIRGEDGNSITGVSFDDRDLIIETTNDAEAARIPLVRGEDGVTITDIGVNSTNDALLISVSDQAEPLEFPQIRGIDATESITSIVLGGDDNRDLIITKGDTSVITVPLLRGEDGVTINSINITDGVLNIEVSDETSVSFDLTTLAGIDGNSITSVELGGDDGRDLIISTNLPSPYDEFIIPGVKGEDGVGIENIELTNDYQDITIELTDGTSKVLEGVGIRVIGADIDEDTGALVLTLNDGSTLTSTNPIKGRDGLGDGVTDVVLEDNSLKVTIASPSGAETEIDAGSIEIINVSGARIEVDPILNEGILFIEFDNGTEIEIGNVYGENGRFVTSVDLVPDSENPEIENLVLTFNDGSTVNAGNAKGKSGRSVSSAEVAFGGDMIIGYDDGTFDNIGNIGTGAGLSVWNEDRKPYVKDQVVIHEGGLYMSLIAVNNDEPPSANWVALALGDQMVPIRKPYLLAPIDGATAFSTRPTLYGSAYAPIVSIDERDYREFQIDTLLGDFSSPVYTASENSDKHEVEGFDLTVGTTYKWRCRDISLRGDVSAWSEEKSFMIPSEIVETPVVTINPEEDINNAFIAPSWNVSDFAMEVGTDSHVNTDWQIRNSSGAIIWESLADADNKNSIIVPAGYLSKGMNYEIRAKLRGSKAESIWSDWVGFTVSSMNYIETPIITTENELEFTASPFRKTEAFMEFGGVELIQTSAIWTVIKESDNSIVEQFEKTSNMTKFTRVANLESNVNYRVTVEYVSDRFGSEVSDPYSFEFIQYIEAPIISTEEDINEFPNGGVVVASPFVGVGDTHVSTDWEVRDYNTDELLWSSYADTVNKTSISIPVKFTIGGMDVKIRARFNGSFISGPWSNVLDVFTAEVNTGPGPQVLLAGDSNDGFFGEVPASELFTGNELASLVGLTAGTSQNSSEPWLKFAIDGEIVYIAKKPLRHSITWDNLYAAGVVYGTDDNGLYPTGTPTNQNKTVTKNGYQFKVRLMTGAHADPATRSFSVANSNSGEGSEWNRLMYRVHQSVPTGVEANDGGPQIGPNWASYTDADLVVGSGFGRSSWTQEALASTPANRIYRGTSRISYLDHQSSAYTSTPYGWRPLLQLVR